VWQRLAFSAMTALPRSLGPSYAGSSGMKRRRRRRNVMPFVFLDASHEARIREPYQGDCAQWVGFA
ncbi:MAG TPA: hypothetical protein VHS80_04745, partial [Chthoniobacterales bacterium]|nr:hypothetical protein [Chthoniobacterales bacterium]